MPDTAHFTQAQLWRQPAVRWIAHVDMDAFFASVEQHDDPNLKGLPVVVANSPLPMESLRAMAAAVAEVEPRPEFIRGVRGVVASASYEVRTFGVRSAMPLAKALALCPEAVVLPGRFDRYAAVAADLRRIWSDFSPVIEPLSLDEAFLDLTGSELSLGPVPVVAERLKTRVFEETGLTCSVGVASSKLVAKIASDLRKPNGLVIVAQGEEAQTLAPLPVRALPGIGPRTAESLQRLGITTVGELASASEATLALRFGPEHGADLSRRAKGIDSSPVQPPGDPKSISRETTLAEDTADLAALMRILRKLSERVGYSLRREGLQARCVTLKLRLLPTRRIWRPEGGAYGRLITRQVTLPTPTDSGQTIYEQASSLLGVAHKKSGLETGKETVRLIGVGTSEFLPGVVPRGAGSDHIEQAGPPSEGARDSRERDARLNASLDAIRERYGFGSISLGAARERPAVEGPARQAPGSRPDHKTPE